MMPSTLGDFLCRMLSVKSRPLVSSAGWVPMLVKLTFSSRPYPDLGTVNVWLRRKPPASRKNVMDWSLRSA